MTISVQSTPQTRAATQGIAIALGDSIAAGIGSSLPRSRGNAAILSDWLARLTGEIVPSQNLAVPGETAASFIDSGQLQRFRDTMATVRASGVPVAVVTVSLGGNELLALDASGLNNRQAGLDEFSTRYDEALTAIRDEIGPDTPLNVMTLYDLTEGDTTIQYSDAWWIEQFNAVIRRAAEDHGALVADVASSFKGKIGEYTHAPYDVHPTNAGHLAIARAIWSILALDDQPPSIAVEPAITTSRTTPTIQFEASDNVAVSSVSVTSNGVALRGPFEIKDHQYVVLVDLRSTEREEVALSIEISDDAGNVTRQEVTVRSAAKGRSESQ